jgi:hypothetical protein
MDWHIASCGYNQANLVFTDLDKLSQNSKVELAV